MIRFGRTSLGIDISDDSVSIAVVARVKGGVKLLKCAKALLPAGAVVEGNISDCQILAGTIKDLLVRNKIRQRRANISLSGNPILTQIINLPNEAPRNIGKFILGQVKHSAALSGKKICYDFCCVNDGPVGEKRVFITAVGEEKIAALLKTLTLARVEPVSLEPIPAAYARAFYEKKITGKYGSNVILTAIHGRTASICVFRKESLDFVRSIEYSTCDIKSEAGLDCLIGEINSVIQFYDIDVAEQTDKFELLMAVDDSDVTVEFLRKQLEAKINIPYSVIGSSEFFRDQTIGISSDGSVSDVSLAAVGLALRGQHNPRWSQFELNLLPVEVINAEFIRKVILVFSNAAAVVFISMLIASCVLSFRASAVKASQQRQGSDCEEVKYLTVRQSELDTEVNDITLRYEALNKVLSANRSNRWDNILAEIGRNIPQKLRLDKITRENGSNVMLSGASLSYQAINTFVELLNGCGLFKSVSLSKTIKEDSKRNIIYYSINCVLIEGGEIK